MKLTTILFWTAAFVASSPLQDKAKFDKEFKNDQLVIKYSLKKISSTAVKMSGRIVEKSSQSPVIGMNILLKDHPVGIISDKDGYFSLDLPVMDGKVIFYFVGYETVEIPFRMKK